MPQKHYYIDEATNLHNTLSTQNINVIYTGYHKEDAYFVAGEHSHSFCEILYVINGSGKTIVDGTQYKIHTGDIIIINANVTHKEISDEKDKLNLVFLAIDNFTYNSLPKNHLISIHDPCVISGKNYRYKIESYFTDLLSETSNQIELSSFMIKNLVGALLALIIRLYLTIPAEQNSYEQDCLNIKEYIDQNYQSPLTLDSLSEQVFLSKYYLSHIFKTQTGTSPIKYMINKRITQAATLLVNTDMPIKDIAAAVGYDDPVYFSQMFKKIQNVSPATYRNNNK